MKIHCNFTGGNIDVKNIDGDNIFVERQLRDTVGDWFYWAFCVEGAAGKKLTFNFQRDRLGYFGPAVSHDLKDWHWLGSCDGDSFTYQFGENEDKVYFAHNMLYHPDRFYALTEKLNLDVRELCTGYKGRSVPCVGFGGGDISIILTARHHCCESTGNYVLEGVITELCENPCNDIKAFCVPFVDFEGVVDGDQGKNRAPFDHNRDYNADTAPIYPETAAIRKYALENGCHLGFDFHSPWHKGAENDTMFIVCGLPKNIAKYNRFGEIFKSEITDKAFKYDPANNYKPNTGWNQSDSPQFAKFMQKLPENNVAFTLETAYFGTPENRVSQENLIESGRCFARALKEYIKEL